MSSDLERRIAKLEAKLETPLGPLRIVFIETDDRGRATRALDGDTVLAVRKEGETEAAFELRAVGPDALHIRMVPDTGPLVAEGATSDP